MNLLLRSLGLCVVMSPLGAALAQWPEKPVTIVSSASPGAGQDVVARTIATGLSEALGQQVVVENKPGARTIVATLAVVRAKPDGYTLGTVGNSAMAANVFMVKNLPYDPEKDLVPVTMIINSAPILLLVHPSVAARSLQELVQLARQQPGKLTYSVSGNLAPMSGDILAKTAGIALRQVRYKDSNNGVVDLLAGRVDAGFVGQVLALPFLKEGRLRPVVVVSRQRVALLPDVPALEEIYPGIAVEGWFALVGPAGLPADIAGRIRAALAPYLKRPEIQKRFNDIGLTSKGVTSLEETQAFIRSEKERWGRIAGELGTKAQ